MVRRSSTVIGVACLLGLGLSSRGGADGGSSPDAKPGPGATAPAPAVLPAFDPQKKKERGDGYVVELPKGRTAVLTLDPRLQRHLERELAKNAVPRAGIVALDPKTGRVLAYVSRDTGEFGHVDVVRSAEAPAASVFKLITAAALVDRGVGPKREVCYHGGLHGLTKADIEDGPRDHRCDTLSSGVARSLNAVFAKLALKHLDRPTLTRYAEAFGFGQRLPLEVPVERSRLDVPDPAVDRLEFGKMAAGFFHTTLSPMHGALIASTFANRGRMPRPYLVAHVEERDGSVTHRAEPAVLREVVPAATARAVGKMMEGTVTVGTARSAFMDHRGWPYLPNVAVAGKTGTLSEEKPYRGYTWWVGYAPADDPQIAVAALVVNTPLWRVKASQVAREALRVHLLSKRGEARKVEGPAKVR